MRKKAITAILLSILLGTSCLVSAEAYQYRTYQQMNEQSYDRIDQLAFLKENIYLEQMQDIEVGVELSGIIYDEKLQAIDIENRIEQMSSILQGATIEKSGVGYQYLFSLKNQKDIHENTYYHLKIVGSNVKILDQLRNKGYAQLKAWQVTPKETIYFKGIVPGALSHAESIQIKDELFKNLEVKPTNNYQDDLIETTCVYYGYTPYINEYIIEADGKKSNVQVGFKYNELQDQTEIMIAFPFYNQPF